MNNIYLGKNVNSFLYKTKKKVRHRKNIFILNMTCKNIYLNKKNINDYNPLL